MNRPHRVSRSHENPSTESMLADLPASSGCYIFRGAGDEPLYVGKAKDLRSRVRSYYRGGDGRPLIPFLASARCASRTVVTRTEAEAILLEDHAHQAAEAAVQPPPQGRQGVLVASPRSEREVPKIRVGAPAGADRALYFGPYASAGALRRTVRFLHPVIPLRDCSDSILGNRSRPASSTRSGDARRHVWD